MSFQPRLSLIAGTLSLAFSDLMHLALVIMVAAIMYAGAVMCTFSEQAEQLSGYEYTILYILKYLLLGDDEKVFFVSQPAARRGEGAALAWTRQAPHSLVFLLM